MYMHYQKDMITHDTHDMAFVKGSIVALITWITQRPNHSAIPALVNKGAKVTGAASTYVLCLSSRYF